MESISNTGAAFANAHIVQGNSAPIGNESPVARGQTDSVTSTVSKGIASENSTKVNFSNADTNTREVEPDVQQAVSELEEFTSNSELKLAFSIDDRTDKSVVTLKDKESGDVIRQIPSQELLDIAAQVKQITSENGSAVGLLVNGKF